VKCFSIRQAPSATATSGATIGAADGDEDPPRPLGNAPGARLDELRPEERVARAEQKPRARGAAVLEPLGAGARVDDEVHRQRVGGEIVQDDDALARGGEPRQVGRAQ
jgi:hypothetical protein